MRVVLLAALPLLAGCAATMTPDIYYAKNDLPVPSVKGFPHCHGYGCNRVDSVALRPGEWSRIGKIFPAKTAVDERAKIAQAVGEFEKIVGAITGTSEDVEGTFAKMGFYQQDCIDESTNTTTYLMLMAQKGWLKFHDVQAPNSRPPFFSGHVGPHRTAVVKDRKTGVKYAVDSWFHNNGAMAEIIELDKWKSGWHPPAREIIHAQPIKTPPAKPGDRKKAGRSPSK